ncbi:MAG: TetR/AcrR family transcriptional regulator [Actinomycetia bacterium]|nr:TetR/AcrR family transcriptional regulator [Actinomycetes bacterium]
MRRGSRTRVDAKPGAKVDARSERWREHRKRVRSEIVDAAFRAIDKLGPEVSLREIAEEAGTAKPKIYRHFTDKSDLFQSIGQRMRDMLWAAIFPSIDISKDPARAIISHAVTQYVLLVDEHPNVMRFLIQGRFAEQSESRLRALSDNREITLAMADMFSNELREMELDAAAFELAAFATFGAATSATDWWLGSKDDGPRRLPSSKFVEYLTTIMLGSIDGTCEVLGIRIDPDLPLHEGVQRREHVA